MPTLADFPISQEDQHIQPIRNKEKPKIRFDWSKIKGKILESGK
jgi:hypothetical protein